MVCVAAVIVPLGVLVTATTGCAGLSEHDRALTLASLDDATNELARLSQARAFEPTTAWTWSQTLQHGAQSIEYSMAGYPQPRSELFQRTLGAAAIKVFAWHGRMTHDLGEPIPGAPALMAATGVDLSTLRLQQAVDAYGQWQGPLRPHFAYGDLDKAQYAHAHAMHLANHFSAFGRPT